MDAFSLSSSHPRRPRMAVERDGGGCLRIAVSVFSIYYWISALVHVFIGLWMLLDPKRNYILDLVHFSENDPLLKASAYVSLCTGCAQLLIGFLGLCGAVNRNKFLLYMFTVFLICTFLADVAMGTLSLFYKDKFSNNYMETYLHNMTNTRYSRDRWVMPLLDTIQFYHQCCGGTGPTDYKDSFWYITNTLRGTRSFVPPSCCKQAQVGRAWAPIPIDPMCTTYRYHTTAFHTSVNDVGCHEKLQVWFNEQIWIFVVFGFGSALTMMLGICLSCCFISKIRTYFYIKDDY